MHEYLEETLARVAAGTSTLKDAEILRQCIDERDRWVLRFAALERQRDAARDALRGWLGEDSSRQGGSDE